MHLYLFANNEIGCMFLTVLIKQCQNIRLEMWVFLEVLRDLTMQEEIGSQLMFSIG